MINIITFFRTFFAPNSVIVPKKQPAIVGYFHYDKNTNCVCAHDIRNEKNVSYPLGDNVNLSNLQHNETVYGEIIDDKFYKGLSEWQ